MSERLLSPNQNQQKIISLTRTDRWLSVIRHHSNPDQRIAALDWNDLAIECQSWPGSVAIVEVNDVNLAAACQFCLDRPHVRATCGLFAVTDFQSDETTSANALAANALAVSGFQWTCDSPLTATRLFRQVERYHRENQPGDVGIEAGFRQRLPWKRVGRYAGSPLKTTRFSMHSNNGPIESAITSDSTDDDNQSHD